MLNAFSNQMPYPLPGGMGSMPGMPGMGGLPFNPGMNPSKNIKICLLFIF